MLAISYDNPPTSTVCHNPANEIDDVDQTAGTAWITPVHDAAGNMLTVPKPTSLADGLTCKYDAWNRLVEVIDDEITVGRYTYDGLNRRIIRAYDSQSPGSPAGVDQCVHYFYNINWQVLETRETSSSTAQAESLQPRYQYVWSPRYIDSPILRDENTDTDDLCDDDRIYFLGDANMNVIALCDAAGDVIERYYYAPYGGVMIYDAVWSNNRAASSYDNSLLYTGRELDPETGLYHYRNRYYSTQLGRFVSRDPIGYLAGDANLYRYVGNSPLNAIDAIGTACTFVDNHDWYWNHPSGFDREKTICSEHWTPDPASVVSFSFSVTLSVTDRTKVSFSLAVKTSVGIDLFGNGETLEASAAISDEIIVGLTAAYNITKKWEYKEYQRVRECHRVRVHCDYPTEKWCCEQPGELPPGWNAYLGNDGVGSNSFYPHVMDPSTLSHGRKVWLVKETCTTLGEVPNSRFTRWLNQWQLRRAGVVIGEYTSEVAADAAAAANITQRGQQYYYELYNTVTHAIQPPQ